LLHAILEVNARAVTAYLNAQIEAGAQVAMIFDTWGGVLAHEDYETFSLAYTRKVLANLTKRQGGEHVPSILFTKGGNPWLAAMMQSGCDAVGLDWMTDPRAARQLAAGRVALQGNLDPVVLLSSPEKAREAARKVIDRFGIESGHVFNLGHGILPQTSPDCVAAVIDEVRAYSRRLRGAAS
jgi:uroporphyrinogen decarboxylase